MIPLGSENFSASGVSKLLTDVFLPELETFQKLIRNAWHLINYIENISSSG